MRRRTFLKRVEIIYRTTRYNIMSHYNKLRGFWTLRVTQIIPVRIFIYSAFLIGYIEQETPIVTYEMSDEIQILCVRK